MKDEFLVEVHLLHQSQPIERDRAINTYTKDGMFCVASYTDSDGVVMVEKYPVAHVFRVTEFKS